MPPEPRSNASRAESDRNPEPDAARPVAALAASLDAVASRVRLLLIIRAGAGLLACVLLVALALGLIDLGLRLPIPVRLVLLVGGIGCLAVGVRRFIVPAVKWQIGRAAMAHRLEQLFPEHAGAIAPAVDLLGQTAGDEETNAIACAGVARAASHVSQLRATELIRYAGISRSAGALGIAAALILLLAIVSPRMTGIGAQRVLTPWTDAEWPTRFGITDLTTAEIHPADEALAVRVSVGPSDPKSRVQIEWESGTGGVIQRTPMTAQPTGDTIGRNYERLIDPSAANISTASDDPGVLRYRVVSPDDRTAWTTVKLVSPPEVTRAIAEITPPRHAAGAPGLSNFRSGDIELPVGDAGLGPLLGGSSVSVLWTFSSDVRPIETDQWCPQPLDVSQPMPNQIRVSVSADTLTRIVPEVIDQYGLGVRLPVSVGLDIRPDAAPSVQIASPGSDQIITPDASIETRVESVDEVGIISLQLEAERFSAPPNSPGAPLESVGSPSLVEARGDAANPRTRVELETVFLPASLGAEPGDEVVLVGIATDTRELEGRVRSQPRRLRVVSQEDFAARLRSQLDPISGLLLRNDEQQRSLIEQSSNIDREAGTITREQIALGDSIASARQAVRELARSARSNKVDDAALQSLLLELDQTLDEGIDAAREAARLTEADQPNEAVTSQREVRERLGEAISMLDRGSDAYLARRAISRLREQLEQTQQRTADVGQRTAGQAQSEIEQADRDELDRLGQSQSELADRAREALEELERRAEALERDDPAQAEALRRAAESGRASDIASVIQQGGEQTEQNQTGQAQQSQQEALDQLEEMLEQIDSAAGLRDTALRRKLADLIQSIEALIVSQDRALENLAAAEVSGDLRGLAQQMITLRNNTLGVIDDASAALAELRLIAESLRDAEAEQTQAILALRAAPVDLAQARINEERSLARLREALEEANRQDDQAEQREQDRKKAELRNAYREALQSQASLRDDAAPLIGRRLTRRQRIESRQLSTAQRELAGSVEAIRAGTEELADAPVFGLAHDQLDLLMRGAAEGLAASSPGTAITLDQENAIALLASLVEVLSDQNQANNEDFQEGSSGDGGGGGAGEGDQPLIPPVAELRLLRDMQGAAMVMTRRISEEPALASDRDRVRRLADLQGALAERGSALIERLTQSPGGSGLPTPPADTEDGTETEQPAEPSERTESGTDSADGDP